MRIEETVDLTEDFKGSSAEHVGDNFFSVVDGDITDFIRRLRACDIVIDVSNSEKEISYEMFGKKRIATIPFAFPDNSRGAEVTKYLLNNSENSLNIEIANYHREDRSPRARPGASYSVTGGIKCKIVFEGPFHTQAMNDVNKINKTLREFYKP